MSTSPDFNRITAKDLDSISTISLVRLVFTQPSITKRIINGKQSIGNTVRVVMISMIFLKILFSQMK